MDLKAWRTERLRLLKQTPEYRGLALVDRQTVDYLVRAHDNPENGMFVSQNNKKLLAKFEVRRQAMMFRFRRIVEAGVFTVDPRDLANGRKTTNRYRINEATLYADRTQSEYSDRTQSEPRTVRPTVLATVLLEGDCRPQAEAAPIERHSEASLRMQDVMEGAGENESTQSAAFAKASGDEDNPESGPPNMTTSRKETEARSGDQDIVVALIMKHAPEFDERERIVGREQTNDEWAAWVERQIQTRDRIAAANAAVGF